MSAPSAHTLTSGVFDPTFGTEGKVVLNHLITAMAVLSIGPIIALAESKSLVLFNVLDNERGVTAVAKLTDRGALDTAFNNGNGYLIETFEENAIINPLSIKQLDDGRILTLTAYLNLKTAEYIPSLALYEADGTPVRSFGINGRSTIHSLPPLEGVSQYTLEQIKTAVPQPTGSTTLQSASLQVSDKGNITFAFHHRIPVASIPAHHYLIQLDSNGSLNTDFQNTGYVKYTLDGPAMSIHNFTPRPEGGWYLVGVLNQNAALAAVKDDGALDTSFNGTGFRIIRNSSLPSAFRSVFVKADHTVLTAGSQESSTAMASIAFILGTSPSGQPSEKFINVSYNQPMKESSFIGLTSTPTDSLIWATVNVTTPTTVQSLIGRFTPQGQFDNTFGDGGYYPMPLHDEIVSVATQFDGKLLTTNHEGPQEGETQWRWTIRRLLV
jgi:uncharacterized delta-60 repeat protein